MSRPTTTSYNDSVCSGSIFSMIIIPIFTGVLTATPSNLSDPEFILKYSNKRYNNCNYRVWRRLSDRALPGKIIGDKSISQSEAQEI